MATFDIKVPNKNFTELQTYIGNELATGVNGLKAKYGTIVDEVAANSNIPAALLYSFMMVLSNGKNNSAWVSSDTHTRSGLFSLSDKVGKEVLARERAKGRMNDAELAFLRGAGDANLNIFLGDEKPSGSQNANKWWKSAASVGINRISKTSQVIPINWTNPKIAIQTGAIWIGQVWDEISQYDKRTPLDKVIITITMPYGSQIQAGTKKFYINATTGGYMSGSQIVKHRPFNTDYTTGTTEKKGNKIFRTPSVWLPAGTGYEDKSWESGHIMGSSLPVQKGSSAIINPRGGSVGWAMNLIMAKGGLLEKMTA